jgi:c-di-GMP-binding flagellar brake protein YcgR
VKWRGKSIDLSEKAMALSCFASFADGTPLMAEIKLSSTQTITLQSTVLRSRPPLRPTDPNELVLLFTDQSERDQHFIRRYIFRQQILNRRKEHDDDNR